MVDSKLKCVGTKPIKNRQSNFELLRIVAMLLIIGHHFSLYSGFESPTNCITIPSLWVQFIAMGGKIGVNIFVLISGYFLITAQETQYKRIIKIWLQLLFYSAGIYIIVLALGFEEFSIKAMIKNLLPVTFRVWWFASAYIVLYFLIPFINLFLKSIDKRTYQSLLLTVFFIWCIIPTFLTKPLESNYLLWFMFLYSVAAYIRLWSDSVNAHCKIYFLIAGILVLLTFLSVVIFDLLGIRVPIIGMHATYFYDIQKLPIVMISVFVFLGFKNLKLKYCKAINIIASATFGIYLIHDNEYIRQLLWTKIFKSVEYSQTPFIIPYSLAVICVVFAVCGAIELIRIDLIEKKYVSVIDACEANLSMMAKKMRLCVEKLIDKL